MQSKQPAKEKWMKICSGKSTEMLISKVSAFKEPKFRADGNYSVFIRATFDERRNIIRSSSKKVTRDEKNHRYQAHYIAEEKVLSDPHLRANFEILPISDRAASIYTLLAKRAMVAQDREQEVEKKNKSRIFISQAVLESYFLGDKIEGKKIQLMSNLTFNLESVIPVFSELPNETVGTATIPHTLLFDYTDISFVNRCTEEELTKAIEMSQEHENTIQCNCSSVDNVVPCYENKNCPCYILNKKMQDCRGNAGTPSTTKFRSFDPVFFNKNEHTFGSHFGFACSELCGCKGNCTNNVTMMIGKNIFPLEVFRNNERMGFAVRSSVMIPAGTPIMEFTGEIVEKLERESNDYAFRISYGDDYELKRVVNEMPFTDEYMDLLNVLFNKVVYIDPKNHGNVGRMACHSCNANMEAVRIYQKSLSPAHVRLIFISLLDIYPGTPLTFDYGSTYIKEHLNGKCECGSFVCANGKDYKVFNKLDCDGFVRCFQHLNNLEYEKWDEEVYTPVCEYRKQLESEENNNNDIIYLD